MRKSTLYSGIVTMIVVIVAVAITIVASGCYPWGVDVFVKG